MDDEIRDGIVLTLENGFKVTVFSPRSGWDASTIKVYRRRGFALSNVLNRVLLQYCHTDEIMEDLFIKINEFIQNSNPDGGKFKSKAARAKTTSLHKNYVFCILQRKRKRNVRRQPPPHRPAQKLLRRHLFLA